MSLKISNAAGLKTAKDLCLQPLHRTSHSSHCKWRGQVHRALLFSPVVSYEQKLKSHLGICIPWPLRATNCILIAFPYCLWDICAVKCFIQSLRISRYTVSFYYYWWRQNTSQLRRVGNLNRQLHRNRTTKYPHLSINKRNVNIRGSQSKWYEAINEKTAFYQSNPTLLGSAYKAQGPLYCTLQLCIGWYPSLRFQKLLLVRPDVRTF